MPPKQSKTLKRGTRVKLSLAVCISIWDGSAFGQALPTATEAFNLRIKCKELVDEKTQTMTEEFYRPKAPELEFFYSSSHYDARVNRC
jgi:hypothetical protein